MSDGSLRGKTEGSAGGIKLERAPMLLWEFQRRFRANNTLALAFPRAVASDPVGVYKTVGRFLGRKEGTELFVSPPQETGK